jgi:uncharacterized repeat protein (TIGR01451 family)
MPASCLSYYMKKRIQPILLLLLLVSVCGALHAQLAARWQHTKHLTWTHQGLMPSAADDMGNLYHVETDSVGFHRVSVVKLDAYGMTVWKTDLGRGYCYAMDYHPAGFLVVAMSPINILGGTGSRIVKLGLDGSVLAQRDESDMMPTSDFPAGISLCDNGDILAVTLKQGMPDTLRCSRIDTFMVPVWTQDKIVLDAGQSAKMAEDNSGDIVLGIGAFDIGVGGYTSLEKMSASGGNVWGPLTPTPGKMLADLEILASNEIALLTYEESTPGSGSYIYTRVLGFSSGGSFVWDYHNFTAGILHQFNSLEPRPGGGALVTGLVEDGLTSGPVYSTEYMGLSATGALDWTFAPTGGLAGETSTWEAEVGPDGYYYGTLTKDHCTGAAFAPYTNGLHLYRMDPATGAADSFSVVYPCGPTTNLSMSRVAFNSLGDIFLTCFDQELGGPGPSISYQARLCQGCEPGGSSFSGVMGRVHVDADSDCLNDAAEMGYDDRPVLISGSGGSALPLPSGDYAELLPLGSYTLTHIAPPLWQHNCASGTHSVTLSSGAPVAEDLDIHLIPLTAAQDLVARISCGPARPGFMQQIVIQIANEGTVPVAGTLQLTLDALCTYSSASTPYTGMAGSDLLWDCGTLAPLTDSVIVVYVAVSPAATLGAPYLHSLQALPVAADLFPTTNTETCGGVFTGSFDPNAKAVSPTDSLTAADGTLTYTVFFQNTGTDTAFTVVVRDTLDPDLDLSTLVMEYASHPYALSYQPTRCLTWTFDNILLPDSNTNEPASHGLLRFRINRNPGGALLDEYTNRAAIYFDYNVPVLTNTVRSVQAELYTAAEALGSERTLVCYPNPSHSMLWVQMPGTCALEVELWSMNGQLVLRSTRAGETLSLDLEGMASGLYLVRARREGEWESVRVVRE